MSKTMTRFGWLLGPLAAASSVACGSEPFDAVDYVGSNQLPIIDGQLEHGWPAVGALVFSHSYDGAGKNGITCTATLIAPQWVLTAAHCLKDVDYAPPPFITYFYVGDDARTPGAGLPTSGQIFAADAFVTHPAYVPPSTDNDIALVHLATPATGVTPIAFNADASKVQTATSLLYVGYGVDDGAALTGAGIKRSTSMTIDWFDSTRYYSNFNGTGTCYGDSGGPGLAGSSGDATVVGINSEHFSGSGVPCESGYIARIRVDAYASWIAATLQAPVPSCQATASLCPCSAGCGAQGQCDRAVCETRSCGDILSCGFGCAASDPECPVTCYATGTAFARARYERLYACAKTACGGLSGSTLAGCLSAECGTELNDCQNGVDPGQDEGTEDVEAGATDSQVPDSPVEDAAIDPDQHDGSPPEDAAQQDDGGSELGGAGGSGSVSPRAAADDTGCSCRMDGARDARSPSWWALMVFVAAIGARHAQRRKPGVGVK